MPAGLALVNPYLEEHDVRGTLASTMRPPRIPSPNGVQPSPPRRSIHLPEPIEQSGRHPNPLRNAKTPCRSESLTPLPPK